MEKIILFTIGIYLIISILLGIIANKKSINTSEDYFIANRSLNWFSLSMTMFATWMSTFAFLGSPGFYFKNGVNWFLPHGLLVVASPFLLWFIGRKIWHLGREKGYVTPADMLGDFYNSIVVKYIVGIIGLLAILPYSLIQLVGIGKALEASTDGILNYETGVLIALSAIAIYTIIGGIRAIVWTDILQGVLFGGLMIIGAVLVFNEAGAEAYRTSIEINHKAFNFNPDNFGSPLSLAIIWTFGYILLPHMWQRIYMAKSAEALTKSIVIGTVLALILIVIPSLIMGTLGIGIFENLQDSDKLVPTIFKDLAPTLLPLLMLATFAAGMSTVDSQMLSASSIFVKDIISPIAKKSIPKEKERLIGRIFVLTFVFLLGYLAMKPENQGSIILLASKGTGIALLLLVPLIGPIAWTKASKYGGLMALIIGLFIMLVLELKLIDITIPYGFKIPIISFIIQLPVFIIVSYLIPNNMKQSNR